MDVGDPSDADPRRAGARFATRRYDPMGLLVAKVLRGPAVDAAAGDGGHLLWSFASETAALG